MDTIHTRQTVPVHNHQLLTYGRVSVETAWVGTIRTYLYRKAALMCSYLKGRRASPITDKKDVRCIFLILAMQRQQKKHTASAA